MGSPNPNSEGGRTNNTEAAKQIHKEMAQSRVPVTMRDFFFDDPFFKNSWDDFDKVRDKCSLNQGTCGRDLMMTSETWPACRITSCLSLPKMHHQVFRNLKEKNLPMRTEIL